MNLTGIVVTYNTPEITKEAVLSIRKFYRSIKIIIIDGSTMSIGYNWIDDNTEVVRIKYNIGHGEGLHLGIKMAKTKYCLLFDSDIEMKSPCIEKMLFKFRPDTYGVGQIVLVDGQGHNIKNKDVAIKYLHPHFCIIDTKMYFNQAPLRNCGAPFIDTMKSLLLTGNKLVSFDVPKNILHKERQTREVIAREEQKETVESSKPLRAPLIAYVKR